MSKVPLRFKEAVPDDWEEGTPLRELIEKYLNDFDEYYGEGRSPLFLGTSGTGKSRAAAAILNTIDKGSNVSITTSWRQASETFNLLLDHRDLRNGSSYYNLLDELYTTDVLVLDDISTLRGSPRLLEYFWMILDRRYADMRTTIMTANFSTENPEEVWNTIGEAFSDAVSRRLKEMSQGLTILI